MDLASLLLSQLLLLPVVTVVSGETAAHPGYAHAEEACSGMLEAEAEKATVLVPAPERREEFDGGRIVDISHYYREDMPEWESSEGSGEFLQLARSMRNGSDIANFSELRLTAHSGTHVDAPGHVFEHYYDTGFDVDTLDLAVLNGPALLVDVPRDKNITGVDYLSVGAFDECIPAHLVFLEKREVILVEALNLEHVSPGIYILHCLPLRLRGAEGSPARCILIK
uniref:Cyclase family protein n=1 Tax=Zea mays TaxID=4577 RepID=B4F9P6_MAIZE|nr:unknown [Zea mays]